MDRVSCCFIFIFLIGKNDATPLGHSIAPVKALLDYNSEHNVPLFWHFEDKSYYLGTIFKANFLEAELFCSLHGMRLLSIFTNDENVFLGQHLFDNDYIGATDSFWTSGTKIPDDDHWVWLTTGTRISFTNWAPGKTGNGSNTEKCLEVNRYKIPRKRDLFWTDQSCATKNYFICELVRSKEVQ